jgi:protein-S-isoprenylcysteine O-methyltransferase Ste14
MLPENLTAGFLVVCLTAFFTVNLHNIIRFHFGKRKSKVYAEVKLPKSPILLFAGLGTLLFFLGSLLFSFFAFSGFLSFLDIFPLKLRFQHDTYVQIAGLVLSGAGYLLFLWSVVARGKYAVSWAMAENHKLVTWGPCRYVRHPSYLGYFLMFFGFFFIWLNLIALFPLVAIPGYIRVAAKEEELLKRRFSDEYIKYQKATGRFLPRLSRTKTTRD